MVNNIPERSKTKIVLDVPKNSHAIGVFEYRSLATNSKRLSIQLKRNSEIPSNSEPTASRLELDAIHVMGQRRLSRATLPKLES